LNIQLKLVEVAYLVLDPLVTGGFWADRVEILQISKKHLSPIFGLGQSFELNLLELNIQLKLVEVVYLVLEPLVTGGFWADRVEILEISKKHLSPIFGLGQSSELNLLDLAEHSTKIGRSGVSRARPLVTGGLCAGRVELL